MKKIIEKILYLITPIAIIGELILPAVPTYADEPKGTITINNATEGEFYSAFRIFDLGHDGFSDADYSYTISESWIPFFSYFGTAKGDGAKYLVDVIGECSNTYSPTEVECKAASAKWTAYNKITVVWPTYTKNPGQIDTKYLKITESNKEQFAKDALNFSLYLAEGDRYTTTESSFENLPLGYYLVYNGGTEKKQKSGNETWTTLASLTTTTPGAEINIKASFPTIKIEADKTNLDVGEEVTFTVKGKIPDVSAYAYYSYSLRDILGEGQSFKELISLSINGVEYKDTLPLEIADDGRYFSFNLLKNLASNDNRCNDFENYAVGSDIIIKYKASTGKAIVNGNVSENIVTLVYNTDPQEPASLAKSTDKVALYSSELKLFKYDGKCILSEEETCEDSSLSGAKFVLYKKVYNSGTGLDDIYYYQARKKENDKFVVITGVPTSAWELDSISWTKNISEATELITDDEGYATFEGLKNGTYYLKETVSPKGYNILTIKDIEVKLGLDDDNADIGKSDATTVIKIPNYAGTALPSTGSVGTKIFIGIGSVLLVVSALLIVTNKRVEKIQNNAKKTH